VTVRATEGAGPKLRRIRASLGISRMDVDFGSAGIGCRSLEHWEQGRRVPAPATLRILLDYYRSLNPTVCDAHDLSEIVQAYAVVDVRYQDLAVAFVHASPAEVWIMWRDATVLQPLR
jgi:transcriptional regulator with XRE-family HTH domain